MTDANAPAKRPDADPKADKSADLAADKTAEEWKPEPRQWTWKDLFTAPMLAFKPKCMLVSAVTLAAIAAWMWIFDSQIMDTPPHYPWLIPVLEWVWYTVALVIFSLGASLVAVFLKADLLDDEFLSFGEALQQYKGRVVPAVLVPLFLMGLLAGVNLALVYIPVLFCSIPYVGPSIYALLYPLGFLFALFVVLLGIAIWLSVFVFPAIVAIRKHGWFDNVVDTIEAVGTKPHVLAASLALTLVMMFFAFRIGVAGINHLKEQRLVLPDAVGTAQQSTESRASEFYADDVLEQFDRLIVRKFDSHRLRSVFAPYNFWGDAHLADMPHGVDYNQYYHLVTGPVTGVWQCLIEALILGYVLNLFVSGGMLTYLVVREDDYWDDEDLEDLDKLAKELEEEAKRDQAPVPATAETVATVPPTAPKPAEPPASPPPAAKP